MHRPVLVSTLALLTTAAHAQSTSSCTKSVSASVPAPSVAPGFEARLVATGLNSPRGIEFDSEGNLLVVEEGTGVTALTLDDAGGSCVDVGRRRIVVDDDSLNHGLALSFDNTTLYASSAESVYSYPYDPQAVRTTGNRRRLLANMTTSDHTTRTLLLSRKDNGTLLVNRGSTSNFDAQAADISSGHSQIKAFSLLNMTDEPYDFNNDGRILGWGLRNDVGVAEEPTRGGIYTVENSADQVRRDGRDVHEDNPAEEMNFLGYMRVPDGEEQSPNQGANFGYPDCYTAWEPSLLPQFDGDVGEAFAINRLTDTNNDSYCQSNFVAPRIPLQAHMAPLDIKFNSAGSQAWITFHGSWDRSEPSGYKVGTVRFDNGEPVEPSTSNTALTDIVSNQDNSRCPRNCFRPVAMAWDRQGRLFFSSDSTGEIYVITRAGTADGEDAGVNDAAPESTGKPPSSSPSGNVASWVGASNPATTTVATVLVYTLFLQ